MADLLRQHRLALPAALALAVVTLSVPAPSSAAETDVFTSTTRTYLGDPGVTLGPGTGFTVPAPLPGTAGPAAPYPALMSFGPGVTATIIDVDLTIQGLTSTAPGDLNVLLVGPGGQQALVMSDIGGPNDVTNVTFTFDDDAFTFLGDGTISNGSSYKPQNQGGDGEVFPSPAPDLNGNSALSVFNGTPVGGTWSLYVVDDQTGDDHTILGWSLRFRLATAPYPNTIDVVGLPPISDVNVRLNGFDAGRSDDAHFMLVGPHGQQAYLMGDAGGTGEIDDAFITLDDEASGLLPDVGGIPNGTYKPHRHSDPAFFPSPAPAGSAAPSLLSVFDGIDPDGQWKLFGVDNVYGELVRLSGWSLEFTWNDVQGPTGAVVINGGAARTGSRDVLVDLSAADPDGTGVAAVRLSNDGVTFSSYQTISASLPWTLSAGDGAKRVYAQFRDAAGNESATAIDSITLDTTGPRAKRLSPRKGRTGVPTTVKVKVKASEALRAATVSRRTVFVKEEGAKGKVAARVSYRAATRTLMLTPRSPLRHHTTYVVTVRGVRDSVGNRWDQKPKKAGARALSWSFATG